MEQKLYPAVRRLDEQDVSRIDMARFTPVWQLDRGWYARDGHYRWTEPYASAHLWRPPGSRRFEVTVNIGPDYIRQIGKVTLEVKVGAGDL